MSHFPDKLELEVLENYDPDLSFDPYWVSNTCTYQQYDDFEPEPNCDLNQPFRHNTPSEDIPRFQTPSRNITANTYARFTPQQTCEAPSQQTPPFGINSTPPSSMTLPFPVKTNENSLPSSVIQKDKLAPPEDTIKLHPKLKVESKIGLLAVKLARGAFFGIDVMAKCTVQGARDFPGLPTAELGELKKTLFGLFPLYWQNPAEFEPLWATCIESIGQACKRLRHTKQ